MEKMLYILSEKRNIVWDKNDNLRRLDHDCIYGVDSIFAVDFS